MVKHALIALVLFAIAANVFGSDVSAGIGVAGGCFIDEMSNSMPSLSVTTETRYTYLPGNATFYLDVKYLQVAIGYSLLTLGHQTLTQTISGSTTTLLDQDIIGTLGYLVFGLVGEFPIALGPVTLFPMLGIEIDANIMDIGQNGIDLRASMTDAEKADENRFWMRAGIGAEYSISSNAYIRPELIVGYRFPSSSETAAYLNAQKAGFAPLWFTIEPDLSLLIGWNL
ncbi:MAG: hypothetical protein ABSF77_17955 [Spirochaetia bacterium]|jgi:hypothetical protein